MTRKYSPILITISALAFCCSGQSQKKEARHKASQQEHVEFTAEGFNAQILAYQPVRREGVPEKDFEKGLFFLENIKAAVKNKPENFIAGDYWNIAMAFLNLQEPKAHVRLAFQKAIESGPAAICGYIQALGEGRLDEVIPDTYLPFYRDNCVGKTVETETFALEEYIAGQSLDAGLARAIYRIHLDDQKYRKQPGPTPWEKQRPLDQKNQQSIDSLFARHNTYIGRSLVGKKLEPVMWTVIQHSNPEMMERYLPVVHQAVQDEELPEVPLKMLIDRLYAEKHGYQIFGSQPGVDIAEKKARNEIIKEYGLE